MTNPKPPTPARDIMLLKNLFSAAIAAADPALRVPPYLPKPPKGRTIVLVTHEDDIAAYAKRLIRLKDGHVIVDKNNNVADFVESAS